MAFINFIKKWYVVLLALLVAFVVGFYVASVTSETGAISVGTLTGILSASGVGGGIIGFLFRLWLNKRDLSLAHQHRIVEDKTQKLHEYLEAYFIPFSARAQRLEEYLSMIKPNSPPEEVKLCFFRHIHWFGIIRKWIEEKGGTLFLQDLTAEQIIKGFLNKIQSSFLQGGYLDIKDIFVILERAQVNKQWSEFDMELKSEPMNEIYEKYRNWIVNTDLKLYCSYLRCFRLLLDFEINAALQPWYREKPCEPFFKDIDCQRVMEVINVLEETEDRKKEYLKRIGLSEKNK